MRRSALSLVACAAVWVCGCGYQSGRTIDLKDGYIRTQGAIQVWRGETYCLTFDPKGRRMAIVRAEEKSGLELVVYEIESRSCVRVRGDGKAVLVPVLFAPDASALYCLRLHDAGAAVGPGPDAPCELVSVDAGGAVSEMRKLPVSYLPAGRNFDWTLAAICPAKDNGRLLAITSSGNLLETGSKRGPLFDTYGNMWFGGNGWTRVSRDGMATQEAARPAYLVRDQSTARGPMWLQKMEKTSELKGSQVFIDVIWLCHRRALRPGAGQYSPSQAAMVDVCADLQPDMFSNGDSVLLTPSFGFVPGRDMVYLVTQTDIRLVPFEFQPHPAPGSGPEKGPLEKAPPENGPSEKAPPK